MKGLPVTEKEMEQLVWVHSNKFTVPELFRKKFVPQVTYPHACYILKGYAQRGLLHVLKTHPFQKAFYYLTGGAIRTLDGRNRILVRSPRYPIKMNPFERDHDLKVQELRTVFEGELQNVFWVSDFELRSGITPQVKARFLEGGLDKAAWRASWSQERNLGRRTPDGYFEADLEGRRYAFTFEFENKPRSEGKIREMVDYLEDSYPDALKLVVSASEKNTLRMARALQLKIRKDDQPKWYLSYHERVMSLPFRKVWHRLDMPIGNPGQAA